MYSKVFKRFFDILFSLIGMILFLPIFIPIAIALKFTGEGYVFYFQERIGFKNKNFKIWKFATMLKDSPGLGTGSITVKGDWRLTPLGGVLRKTKLNEVPQIVNIFLGDMSFIGPRPLMKVDFDKYPLEVQKTVYNVKPGLSGVASIVFRDEEEYFSNTDMDPHEYDKQFIAPYKGELEKWYQENVSLITDIKVLYYTLIVVLNGNIKLEYNILKGLPKRPEFI